MLLKRGNFYLHQTVIFDEAVDDIRIGAGTRLWAHVHIRAGARLGCDCSIGKGCSIEGVLGDGVRVQNNVSIFKGVTLGDRVFVGPHVVFTNDRAPRIGEPWECETTIVHEGASLGANATIRCGIAIGQYAMVAAGSVVTSTVLPFGLVRGNPARLVGFVCRHGHRMRQKDLASFICERCGDGLDVELRYLRTGGDSPERFPRPVAGTR